MEYVGNIVISVDVGSGCEARLSVAASSLSAAERNALATLMKRVQSPTTMVLGMYTQTKDALLCIFNLKMHFCASLRFLALCPRRAALYGGLGSW